MVCSEHRLPCEPARGRERTQPRRRGSLFSLAAAIAVVSMLAACGASSQDVRVAVNVAHPHSCPGGLVTPAGKRRAAGAGGYAPNGCPYLAAAAIGRPGEGVFRQPEAIAISPSGRAYVADQFSHLVQVFSPRGVFQGQWGAAGTAPGQFGAVGGLAFDQRGDVYLVDSTNDRVEKFTPSGVFVAAWGRRGTGVGEFDFGAGNGPSQPPGGGIAVGAGHVYVADTRNDRIESFALDGSGARVLAAPGSGPGGVNRPQGLAFATAEGSPAAGRSAAPAALYVADNGNRRVQELTPDGRFIVQASSFPATPPTFQNPYDVAVHGNAVYVVDDNHARLVRFDRALRFSGAFGGSGPYKLTHFLRADAVDGAGDVYVADSSANRVVVFNADGTALRGWGTSGISPGQFVAPVAVAAGPGGRLLVAEAYREIVPLVPGTRPGEYRAQIAYGSPWSSGGGVTLGGRFFSPTGLAFAPDGTVWVSDRNNDVLRHLAADGRFITGVGAAAEAGGAGRGKDALALMAPHGVAVAPAGDVLVADTGANRIVKLAANGALLASWPPHASSPAAASANGSGSAGTFSEPLDVAVGANGEVYVANTGKRVLDVLDPRGTPLASWGGAGAEGAARLTSPAASAVDAAGQVFVADAARARVLEFSARGTLLAAWGAPGTAVGQLSEPMGLSIDCHGDVLVADSGNNRVQLFSAAAAPSSCTR
jgi:sugar lactone lactonase YvrE